jgi:hypothetical protein
MAEMTIRELRIQQAYEVLRQYNAFPRQRPRRKLGFPFDQLSAIVKWMLAQLVKSIGAMVARILRNRAK